MSEETLGSACCTKAQHLLRQKLALTALSIECAWITNSVLQMVLQKSANDKIMEYMHTILKVPYTAWLYWCHLTDASIFHPRSGALSYLYAVGIMS